ncbi:MAG: NAD(+) synthase [Actinomycetia bacterium]|nr:NAD(+) synthase [Actinomycetes bacterium]
MYVAIVQNNPTAGALKENSEAALQTIHELASTAYPPDLVVFPAFALCGMPLDGLQFSEAFGLECVDYARQVIKEAPLATVMGTVLPLHLDDGLDSPCESEALYMKDGEGGRLGFSNLEKDDEMPICPSVIRARIDGVQVGMLLDEYPDGDDLSDCDLVIMLLAKDYHGTDSLFTASEQLEFLQEVAREANAWLVVANLVGGAGEMVFDGGSLVMDAYGQVQAQAPVFEDAVLRANITFNASVATTLVESSQRDTTAMAAGASLAVAGSTAAKPIVRPLLPYEADWRALCLATHDYVVKNGFRDVVLGLSGGLDSAVVAAIAVDALGAGHVHGVLMPSPYSSAGSISDAQALADRLGIATMTIPITEPLEGFQRLMPFCSDDLPLDSAAMPDHSTSGTDAANARDTAPAAPAAPAVPANAVAPSDTSAQPSLAAQNLQPRIRMTCLMYLSNCFGWMLLNTGNKSEAAQGYSTIYGDTAGAFSPLGNVYKTNVYGLAHWRNQWHGAAAVGAITAPIPEAIIAKPPSAELYSGQTDQDLLPPYELLDRILHLHIEDGLGVDQILAVLSQDSKVDSAMSATVCEVLDRVRCSEFKRRSLPPAPCLDGMDIGSQLDWPLVNGFCDHQRPCKEHKDIQGYLGLSFSQRGMDGWTFLEN